MKKLITALLCVLIITTGCTIYTKNSSKVNRTLHVENGVEITDVDVQLADNTFNFHVILANRTNEERQIDTSKFTVEKDGQNIQIDSTGPQTVEANNTYKQIIYTMSGTSDLKVGDTVQVYYDSNYLTDVTISEF